MSLPSIDLDVFTKLKDREFRKSFFLAEASAKIAQQLIRLRKRRGLSQGQVAELAGTKQPAVSRAERADYQNWSFSSLRSLADALDGRLRVIIEASEDVIGEYKSEEFAQTAGSHRTLLSEQTAEDSVFPDQIIRVSVNSNETLKKQTGLNPAYTRPHDLLGYQKHGIESNRI